MTALRRGTLSKVPAAVGVTGPGEARAGTAAPMAANSSTVAPVSTGTRVTVAAVVITLASHNVYYVKLNAMLEARMIQS